MDFAGGQNTLQHAVVIVIIIIIIIIIIINTKVMPVYTLLDHRVIRSSNSRETTFIVKYFCLTNDFQ